MKILKETNSICPVCYREIAAQIYENNGRVYIRKNCSEHGDFNFLLEKSAWLYKKLMNRESLSKQSPFDNMMVIVTHTCNLKCNMCYLPSGDDSDISIKDMEKSIASFSGWQIRISGGEPTLSNDLLELVYFISQKGKVPVLVTNGLKLVNINYVRKLKAAGLRYVHFSLNGLNDKVYEGINGKKLLKIKLKALKNLEKEGMNVRLSMTLVKGINEYEFKKVYNFCLKNSHFIHSLRIRSEVPLGRYIGRQHIYLSDIVNIVAKSIGVDSETLVKHSLSHKKQFPCLSGVEPLPYDNAPCQINIKFSLLLYNVLKLQKNEGLSYKKIKTIFAVLLKIGLTNLLIILLRKLRGKNPLAKFYIFIRHWPDKNRVDLDEIKRCHSAHLVNGTGDVIPYCLGMILNGNTLSL